MRWPFIKLNSRDRGLLWFEAETGEHRVVPAKVAAQLLLTEISNKILTDFHTVMCDSGGCIVD